VQRREAAPVRLLRYVNSRPRGVLGAAHYLQLTCLSFLLPARLLVFEVTRNSRSLVIDPNRCGKPLLDFFISELVQFFF